MRLHFLNSMKIDLKNLDIDFAISNERNSFSFFVDQSFEMTEINLENYEIKRRPLEIPDEIEERICIVSIPKNKFFCYGTCVG